MTYDQISSLHKRACEELHVDSSVGLHSSLSDGCLVTMCYAYLNVHNSCLLFISFHSQPTHTHRNNPALWMSLRSVPWPESWWQLQITFPQLFPWPQLADWLQYSITRPQSPCSVCLCTHLELCRAGMFVPTCVTETFSFSVIPSNFSKRYNRWSRYTTSVFLAHLCTKINPVSTQSDLFYLFVFLKFS